MVLISSMACITAVKLSELPRFAIGTVRTVEATSGDDPIARRLADLGFEKGKTGIDAESLAKVILKAKTYL